MNRIWKALLIVNTVAMLVGAYTVTTYFPSLQVAGTVTMGTGQNIDVYGASATNLSITNSHVSYGVQVLIDSVRAPILAAGYGAADVECAAGAGVCAFSWDPSVPSQGSAFLFDCKDTDGCDVTLGYATASGGQIAVMCNYSANTVTFKYVASHVLTAGAADVVMHGDDCIMLIFVSKLMGTGSAWRQIGISHNHA